MHKPVWHTSSVLQFSFVVQDVSVSALTDCQFITHTIIISSSNNNPLNGLRPLNTLSRMFNIIQSTSFGE
jgi:hypothetical protein